MARAKIIAVDESGPEPLYTVEAPDGTKRTGLTAAKVKAAASTPVDKAAAPAEVKITPQEIEAGIVTINEARASKGLPRDARFGDMTLPEYKAATAEVYNLAARASSPSPLVGEPAEHAPGDEADMSDEADDESIEIEEVSE